MDKAPDRLCEHSCPREPGWQEERGSSEGEKRGKGRLSGLGRTSGSNNGEGEIVARRSGMCGKRRRRRGRLKAMLEEG